MCRSQRADGSQDAVKRKRHLVGPLEPGPLRSTIRYGTSPVLSEKKMPTFHAKLLKPAHEFLRSVAMLTSTRVAIDRQTAPGGSVAQVRDFIDLWQWSSHCTHIFFRVGTCTLLLVVSEPHCFFSLYPCSGFVYKHHARFFPAHFSLPLSIARPSNIDNGLHHVIVCPYSTERGEV